MSDSNRTPESFVGLGMQYYIAGRFAAIAAMPVSGNLLHHAVEMFLKGHLSKRRTLKQLKDLGHDLKGIWAAFKKDISECHLDLFDYIVADLDAFEHVRYPDAQLAEGMICVVSVTSSQTGDTLGRLYRFDDRSKAPVSEPVYQLVLDSIDELVATIFSVSSVNPGFFVGSANSDVSRYLHIHNHWLETPTGSKGEEEKPTGDR